MQIQTIGFGALIPSPGFRWIFLDADGKWRLKSPPHDWPEIDYAAARYYDESRPQPELTERFYLAASLDEWHLARQDQKKEFGRLIYEPDLYLRFASEKATPPVIFNYANRYGLLRYKKPLIHFKRSDAEEILHAFDFEMTASSNAVYMRVEKASDWLRAFEGARFLIRTWAEIEAKRNYTEMKSFLDDVFNYEEGGNLTYQVNINTSTGEVHSNVIAASLNDLIELQWRISVATSVIHRQCTECPTWFAVHPGSGRPEKQFCSDACRMRAYRKRKAVKKG